MEYLIQKITSTYEWFSDYYYGQQKIEDISKLSSQEKIIALRKTLKDQCIYSEQVQGKLQMNFTKIVQTLQYRNVCFTTKLPPQHPVPKQNSEKKYMCFFCSYVLQADRIKCPILIEILFQQDFMSRLPKFYIRNPSFPSESKNGQKLIRTAKPKSKLVLLVQNIKNPSQNKKYNYRARCDGIQVIFPERKNDWKLDVKSMIDECIVILKSDFPFVKMKDQVVLVDEDANIDQQTQKLYHSSLLLSKKLKQMTDMSIYENKQESQQNNQTTRLVPFLNVVQQLDIIEKVKLSQTQYLRQQNEIVNQKRVQLEKLQADLLQKPDLSGIYPTISDEPNQKQLFELMVDHQATKDCLIEVERSVNQNNKKILSKQQFQHFMQISQQLNERIFLQRYKIKSLVNRIQQNLQQESKLFKDNS